jgi:hypothetical protein
MSHRSGLIKCLKDYQCKEISSSAFYANNFYKYSLWHGNYQITVWDANGISISFAYPFLHKPFQETFDFKSQK